MIYNKYLKHTFETVPGKYFFFNHLHMLEGIVDYLSPLG